jgi:hypothetical protein
MLSACGSSSFSSSRSVAGALGRSSRRWRRSRPKPVPSAVGKSSSSAIARAAILCASTTVLAGVRNRPRDRTPRCWTVGSTTPVPIRRAWRRTARMRSPRVWARRRPHRITHLLHPLESSTMPHEPARVIAGICPLPRCLRSTVGLGPVAAWPILRSPGYVALSVSDERSVGESRRSCSSATGRRFALVV